jgi:hypothetical protein
MFYTKRALSASGANPVPGQWKKVKISVQADGGGKLVVKRNVAFI